MDDGPSSVRAVQQGLDLRNDVRIAVLFPQDVVGASDTYRDLRDLITRSGDMYPGIDAWFHEKMCVGVRSGRRVAIVGYHNEVPMASAVVKKGADAKFCHLRIRDDVHGRHLGELLFALMANEVRGTAHTVHFTLPEGLWDAKAGFFSSFGFSEVGPCDQQYRLFDRELRCAAPFPRVWQAVSVKLPRLLQEFTSPGRAVLSSLMMAVRPPYVERILRGEKKVEIRRRFSPKWVGHRVTLYASSPSCRIVGEARIADVSVDDPDRVWAGWSSQLGCTRTEYDVYTRGARQVFAIVLKDAIEYDEPLTLQDARGLVGRCIRPPQSYCVIDTESAWGVPVAVGALMRRRLGPCGAVQV